MLKKTKEIVIILVVLGLSVAFVLHSLSHGWITMLMTAALIASLAVTVSAFIWKGQRLVNLAEWLPVIAFVLADGYSLYVSETAANSSIRINALYGALFAGLMALIMMRQMRLTRP